MDRDLLKQELKHLHAQLNSGQSLDPELQNLVTKLADDVERYTELQILDEIDDPDKSHQTILEKLFGLTEDFEKSHPQMAETIGRVASIFSQIGI